jgi:hypothetical protein
MPNLTTPDGVLSGSGWMQPRSQPLLILGGQTTLTLLPRYVLCMASAPWHLYLPAASSVTPVANLTIKKIGAGSHPIRITPQGNDLIEGKSSYRLSTPLDYVTIVSDGISNWYAANESGTFALGMARGLGVFGTYPYEPQPALCVTLADVIAAFVGCGLCASP